MAYVSYFLFLLHFIESIIFNPQDFLVLVVRFTYQSFFDPSFKINSIRNNHPDSYFELEAEIEHLIQLMSTMANPISPAKPNDSTVPVFASLVPNRNQEAQPMNL